jgi:molecular chaperone GrpE
LPVLDAIDGARIHDADAVEPIDAVLHPALVAIGVERIDPSGELFDPEAHDAVAANDDEVENGELVVVEVLRPGYRCRGRLLRPAMVRVGSAAG